MTYRGGWGYRPQDGKTKQKKGPLATKKKALTFGGSTTTVRVTT